MMATPARIKSHQKCCCCFSLRTGTKFIFGADLLGLALYFGTGIGLAAWVASEEKFYIDISYII